MIRLLMALSLCLSLLPLSAAMADNAKTDSVILDDEDEEGFGIPLWGNKSKASETVQEPLPEAVPEAQPEAQPAAVPTAAAVEKTEDTAVTKAQPECIILDDEDEDEDGVCGVAIRFPGDAKSRAKAKREGRPAYDPELYRVVLDEEDETNESGFGIPLPTEDNPNPWNGLDAEPLSEDKRFDEE